MIEQRTRELMSKGKDAYNRGEHDSAKKILSELVEIEDRNPEAFFYLANIFHINGEIGKAIKAFKKVLQFDPNHTDASISLSVLYNDIGRYEDAKKIFDKTSERVKKAKGPSHGIVAEDGHINKKFSLKHSEIAELYMTYNRYDEALFEYNKASSLDTDNLDLRVKIAKVYAKKGFVSKAFEELRKLKNEQPGFVPARLALGILHYGNGNVLEAQSEWQNILSKDPANAEAKMYLNLSKSATETTI